MKTKLISLTYRGEASVDPRFSSCMIPWCVNDICSLENYKKLSLAIENCSLTSYNSDFELVFNHNLKHIVGICQIQNKDDKKIFIQLKKKIDTTNCNQENLMIFNGPINALVYLIKNPKDPLLHVHLFETDSINEMAELMQQMRDPVHLGGSVGNIPETFVTGAGSDSSINRSLNRNNGLHSTPASNLLLAESIKYAQHDSSPNLISSKMSGSKSYTHGLSNSAGMVNNIPTSNSTGVDLSLLSDISPNHTHFFEVMYVGKIRVSHKRVPYTFIDDALPKFKAYDAQRARVLQMNQSRTQSMNSGINSISEDDNNEEENIKENNDAQKIHVTFDDNIEIEKKLDEKDDEIDKNSEDSTNDLKITEEYENNERESSVDSLDEKTVKLLKVDLHDLQEIQIKSDLATSKTKEVKPKRKLTRGQSQIVLPVKQEDGTGIISTIPLPPQISSNYELIPKQRNRSASYGCIPPYNPVEQNRTMVFLIGRSDLRLISPDRKQVLLCKDFKDIASCAQGHKNADHFGIICREGHNDGYIGYVFKCQSDHVCDDIIGAISQAFITCSEQRNKDKAPLFSCEHCPMLWYHKLCSDIEGLNEKKTQAIIFRRIETLTDDEQDIIWAKYYGAEKMNAHSLSEQNQFLMMLLRAHCESRQQRHVHDTAENRSEFLNQYLGGSTIFMKAKRSLTNSFDHLLKRKASKDDIGLAAANQEKPLIKETESNNSGNENSEGNGFRSRSNTLTSNSGKPEPVKSPMMDIFFKVGNSSPKINKAEQQGSWRQAILNSVVTPSKNLDNPTGAEFLSPIRIKKSNREKRTKEELRELWKTAIRQTILLNRMEKENAMLMAQQNENEIKKIKLDYDEISPCDKSLIERWEIIIGANSSKIVNKKDPKMLLGAIKNGIPRTKRGDVWKFLAEQYSINTAPTDIKKFPNFNTPYYTLLKNLTEHQHAIFIDLGRTFPNHKYYKDPLGVGQLSLFNLLKAYSILDPELGYCQGLGFICGVLLLHADEENAFQLLKHLMFSRNMRTKYLPDMKKFQLQLYQLSRLVKDNLPDLYEWLDQNDVSPTLYAAPWILTVFSSQFPLGFVGRIFDLLFFESSDAIFKAAIALLTVHKDEILAQDNFEDIMEYLKNTVPKIDSNIMDKIMRTIFLLDVQKQLTEYQVEYNVLQEEIANRDHNLDLLSKEKEQNSHLEMQLQFAQSSIAQLEKTRTSQQTQISSLQSQVQTLELTIQNLGSFVKNAIEQNINLEIPSDIIRIVQQLDDIERQKKKPIFLERKINKSVSVNSNLGFPLKVLQELNENSEALSNTVSSQKKKSQYFNNTYEQLRQKASTQRPNKFLDSNIEFKPSNENPKIISKNLDNDINSEQIRRFALSPPEAQNNIKCIDIDSGYCGTPISPIKNLSSSTDLGNEKITVKIEDNEDLIQNSEVHPLSMCGDVCVKFNGTTQLKSIKPIHTRHAGTPSTSTNNYIIHPKFYKS